MDELVANFESERPRLFAIAYRMLGTVADAEDVLQEAYLRFSALAPAEVRSPRALLTTIVTRLCLDHKKSATSRHESYVGPWLPEPVRTDAEISQRGTPDAQVDVAESVSMAFLLLLQSLSPLERAVFLLREVFDYSFDEIAATLERAEPACRQLYHRAKEHVASRRPRFGADPERRRKLTEEFLRACSAGDLEGLTRVLAHDATVVSDSGGRVTAARKVVRGADHVARFLVGTTRRAQAGAEYEFAVLNGEPAVIVRVKGVATAVLGLTVDDEGVREVRFVLNPEKLARL